VRRSLPRLTVGEWCLLWDALNGVWLREPASMAINSVKLEIADHITLNGADITWDVDKGALLDKLDALPFAGLLAIVDAVERFWATSSDRTTSHTQTAIDIVGAQAVDLTGVDLANENQHADADADEGIHPGDAYDERGRAIRDMVYDYLVQAKYDEGDVELAMQEADAIGWNDADELGQLTLSYMLLDPRSLAEGELVGWEPVDWEEWLATVTNENGDYDE